MGYLFALLSVFSGAVKGFCGKKLGNLSNTLQSAVFFNTVRMLLCVLFGFAFVAFSGDISAMSLSFDIMAISALSGISTALFVISWLMIIQKSAYMLVDIFLTLGTIVPMCLCRIIFAERITFRQWIGFFILVAASIVMGSYNNSIKSKLSLASIGLLIFCGVSNGLTNFSQKLFVKQCSEIPTSVFNFYTYVSAAVILAIFLLLHVKGKRFETPMSSVKRGSVLIIIMAIALFLNSYFKTEAAVYLDSAKLYPFSQGASLIVATLMAAIFFKEKVTLKCVFGIILAFVALMVINL